MDAAPLVQGSKRFLSLNKIRVLEEQQYDEIMNNIQQSIDVITKLIDTITLYEDTFGSLPVDGDGDDE